jgi:hypothetical protein
LTLCLLSPSSVIPHLSCSFSVFHSISFLSLIHHSLPSLSSSPSLILLSPQWLTVHRPDR